VPISAVVDRPLVNLGFLTGEMGDYRSLEREAKVVIVGLTTVGKTSIVNCAITGERASEGTRPTVGSNFVTKRQRANGATVALQIWDTAGQERYRSMTPVYFRGAQVAIIVFSVTDSASLQEVLYWHQQIMAVCSSILCLVVGNKIDSADTRLVSPEEGEAMAARISAQYCETSAKNGTGIEPLFDAVAQLAQSVPVYRESAPAHAGASPGSDRSGCC
jgi:small GTP-binding protein